MGSGPSLDVPSWEGQTPTDQAPLQSNSAPINYTGSFGQPSNNFAGMGKSPSAQGAPPQMGVPQQQPMQQVPPMQQPMRQQGPSPYGLLGRDGGIDGAIDPMYMAMRGRPEAQQRYNDRINSRPNIWG